MEMTLAEFTKELRATGTFFMVRFIKRTTGEERTMKARMNVQKYLAGGEPAYNFSEKGLIPVFDMDKMAYRSVPLDAIIDVKWRGTTWELNVDKTKLVEKTS